MSIVVQELEISQTNRFAMDYLKNRESALSFFHYSPFDPTHFPLRVEELDKRSFPRSELAQVIRAGHKRWGTLTQEQETQLQRLERNDSVVVIGGQQAGLLLGPLYTVYKAITIIQAAKEQEQVLQRPVVPVFWIAGEDHDFQEINHVFIPRHDSVYFDKHSVQDKEVSRVSASQRSIHKEDVQEWLDYFFSKLAQTEFTPSLVEQVKELLESSNSYVDFFANLMNHFFAQYGLLLINSDDQGFRRLQSDVFTNIIKHDQTIFRHVSQSIEQMKQSGYAPQVTVGEHPALLFVFEQGERLLLERKNGYFQTKDGQYTFSEEELLGLARETPWRLSNNVITRPLMQESLFPTLAFVGGPGEIAYWALYKDYFNQFELKLPIVLPRMSMTILERPIAKILEKREIHLSDVFHDFSTYRNNWLKEQDNLDLNESFAQVKEQISTIYTPLLAKIESIEPGLRTLGEKNRLKIMEQIEYLEKRSHAAQVRQHEASLRQFDKLEQALIPQGMWQERVYNPFIMLNKHGTDLVKQLVEYPFSLNGKHKFIYL